jgi:hypothetical protein
MTWSPPRRAGGAPAAALTLGPCFSSLAVIVLRALLLAVASALVAGVPAIAGPVVFQPFSGGAALLPGRVVQVRWSGVPAGVDEMELLLSLDGGRHFPVRVTPELDADHGSYSWCVPPLPSRDARLAVRMDRGGREVIAGVSPPFRIAADGASRAWSMRRRNGELWSAVAGDGDPAEEPCGWSSGAPPPQWARGLPVAASLVPPSPRAERPRSALQSAGAPRTAAHLLAMAVAGGERRCAHLPLRI